MKSLSKLFLLFLCLAMTAIAGCSLEGNSSAESSPEQTGVSRAVTTPVSVSGILSGVAFRQGVAIHSGSLYLAVSESENYQVNPRLKQINERGIFYIQQLSGNTFAIWSRSNAKWLCFDRDLADAYGIPLYANRYSVGEWETITRLNDWSFWYQPDPIRGYAWAIQTNGGLRLIQNENGSMFPGIIQENQGCPAAKIALKWQYNGKYLCSDLNYGSAGPLYSNRDAAGRWETFYLMDYGLDANGNNMVALKSWATGKFLAASATGTRLQAGKETPDETSLFNLVSLESRGYGKNSVALQSRVNGMYFRGDSLMPAQANVGTGVALTVVGLDGF